MSEWVPVGPNAIRRARRKELAAQLADMQKRRDEDAAWLRSNVTSKDFMARLQAYNALCCSVATMRTRIKNIKDCQSELGGAVPTSVTQLHRNTTK